MSLQNVTGRDVGEEVLCIVLGGGGGHSGLNYRYLLTAKRLLGEEAMNTKI